MVDAWAAETGGEYGTGKLSVELDVLEGESEANLAAVLGVEVEVGLYKGGEGGGGGNWKPQGS